MGIERRAEERIAIRIEANCRVPATPHRVVIRDVSYTGCRVAFSDGQLPEGATIYLEPSPGSNIPGQVVWAGPASAGIAFHHRLRFEEAVVLGLEEAPPAEPEPEIEDFAAEVKGLQHWIRRTFSFARAPTNGS